MASPATAAAAAIACKSGGSCAGANADGSDGTAAAALNISPNPGPWRLYIAIRRGSNCALTMLGVRAASGTAADVATTEETPCGSACCCCCCCCCCAWPQSGALYETLNPGWSGSRPSSSVCTGSANDCVAPPPRPFATPDATLSESAAAAAAEETAIADIGDDDCGRRGCANVDDASDGPSFSTWLLPAIERIVCSGIAGLAADESDADACRGWINWLMHAIQAHEGLTLLKRPLGSGTFPDWVVQLEPALHRLIPPELEQDAWGTPSDTDHVEVPVKWTTHYGRSETREFSLWKEVMREMKLHIMTGAPQRWRPGNL